MANQHSGFKLISDIDANSKKITNLVDPTTDQEPATKKFLEDEYIPYDGYLSPDNCWGGRRIFIPALNSLFYKADARMTVTQTGFSTWYVNYPFDLNYSSNVRIDAAGTGVITIDTRPDWGSNGMVYPEGYIFLAFYYNYVPESVSGRFQDYNDVWHDWTGAVNVSNNPAFAIWRLTLPDNIYERIYEITINAPAGKAAWLTQIEYFGFRGSGKKLPWQV